MYATKEDISVTVHDYSQTTGKDPSKGEKKKKSSEQADRDGPKGTVRKNF